MLVLNKSNVHDWEQVAEPSTASIIFKLAELDKPKICCLMFLIGKQFLMSFSIGWAKGWQRFFRSMPWFDVACIAECGPMKNIQLILFRISNELKWKILHSEEIHIYFVIHIFKYRFYQSFTFNYGNFFSALRLSTLGQTLFLGSKIISIAAAATIDEFFTFSGSFVIKVFREVASTQTRYRR